MGAFVMGIDAGFAACGAVVVELYPVLYALASRKSGVVRAATCFRNAAPDHRRRGVRVADSDAERCVAMARWMASAPDLWPLSACVVELPHGGSQNGRASRAMGLATGVAATVTALKGWPTEWVTPDAVKIEAGGSRRATKEQVQKGVQSALEWQRGFLDWPKADWEHVADAAGAVLAGMNGALLLALRSGIPAREAVSHG